MSFFSKYKAALAAGPVATPNPVLLKGQGLDLNTILTPKGKRKKSAGIRGGDKEELIATTLGG